MAWKQERRQAWKRTGSCWPCAPQEQSPAPPLPPRQFLAEFFPEAPPRGHKSSWECDRLTSPPAPRALHPKQGRDRHRGRLLGEGGTAPLLTWMEYMVLYWLRKGAILLPGWLQLAQAPNSLACEEEALEKPPAWLSPDLSTWAAPPPGIFTWGRVEEGSPEAKDPLPQRPLPALLCPSCKGRLRLSCSLAGIRTRATHGQPVFLSTPPPFSRDWLEKGPTHRGGRLPVQSVPAWQIFLRKSTKDYKTSVLVQ